MCRLMQSMVELLKEGPMNPDPSKVQYFLHASSNPKWVRVHFLFLWCRLAVECNYMWWKYTWQNCSVLQQIPWVMCGISAAFLLVILAQLTLLQSWKRSVDVVESGLVYICIYICLQCFRNAITVAPPVNYMLGHRARMQCAPRVSAQMVRHVNSIGRRWQVCRQWVQWHWSIANEVRRETASARVADR